MLVRHDKLSRIGASVLLAKAHLLIGGHWRDGAWSAWLHALGVRLQGLRGRLRRRGQGVRVRRCDCCRALSMQDDVLGL